MRNARPYDDPEYAGGHDAAFHDDPANAVHSRFELEMVAELARERPGLSWLDVACGTGLHLANAGGDMRRTCVDRAQAMLDAAPRWRRCALQLRHPTSGETR